MNRKQIYTAIDEERTLQDRAWRTGRDVERQYEFAAPHVIVLEEQVAKLRANWYGAKDELSLRDRLVSIAALAVRALEEIQTTR